MKQMQQGFTLIELMIVVAIIGILAAVALAQYQNHTIRGQISEGLAMASEFKTAISVFRASRGSFPTSNAQADLGSSTGYDGNYVTDMAVDGAGNIVITYGNRANPAITGNLLVIYVGTNASGGVIWRCGYSAGNITAAEGTLSDANATATNVLAQYLPSDCRA
jgi:type IV pilus assembly protein PilA